MRGKDVRLNRILHKGRAVIIPMDHGVTSGPIKGLENMEETVKKVETGGATAVLLHKGIIRSLKRIPECGVIMHLSAGTKLAVEPNNKVQIADVEEALRLGADAVSVHINIGGNDAESNMLQILGKVAGECERLEVPLLAMMYPRGKNIKESLDTEVIALVSRIGAELGADIIKTPFTGNVDTFKQVVKGCPVPIVIAGGPKCENDREVLEMVRDAMNAGAIGVSLGRNAFQHENPTAMIKAIREIIINDVTVGEALKLMRRCK